MYKVSFSCFCVVVFLPPVSSSVSLHPLLCNICRSFSTRYSFYAFHPIFTSLPRLSTHLNPLVVIRCLIYAVQVSQFSQDKKNIIRKSSEVKLNRCVRNRQQSTEVERDGWFAKVHAKANKRNLAGAKVPFYPHGKEILIHLVSLSSVRIDFLRLFLDFVRFDFPALYITIGQKLQQLSVSVPIFIKKKSQLSLEIGR